MRSWVEISDERLVANYAALLHAAQPQRAAGGRPTQVLAVIKANGYGHGLAGCAVTLARAGVPWLGVTDATEGAEVREALRGAGLKTAAQPRVLLMCAPDAAEAGQTVSHGLTPTVWERAQLRVLAEAVSEYGAGADLGVHVEIDSGMCRQGVTPGAALDELLLAIRQEPRLHLEGVFTHFAATEAAHSAKTLAQRGSFQAAIEAVRLAGMAPALVHAGNSSMVDNAQEAVPAAAGAGPGGAEDQRGGDAMDWLASTAAGVGAGAMVRSGLALYGYCLPIEPASITPRLPGVIKPVLRWKTRVASVREIPSGATVGYNATFAASKTMQLALLPVGYADGLRRELSSNTALGDRMARSGGWVMIRGQRAPMVGRVSMNLTSVDVTRIAGVAVGDEVTLLGEGITADDHARLAGTIPYEILCGVRVTRLR